MPFHVDACTCSAAVLFVKAALCPCAAVDDEHPDQAGLSCPAELAFHCHWRILVQAGFRLILEGGFLQVLCCLARRSR